MYSAHDTQIANLVVQITDNDFKLNTCPFASTLKFEVYQQGYNYSIRTLYNNKPIKFKECVEVEICPIDIFINRLFKKITYNEAEIKNKCYSTPTESEIFPGGPSDW